MKKSKQAAHGIILLAVAWLVINYQQPVVAPPPVVVKPVKSHVAKQLERYIGDEYLAEVLAQSKRPYLYAGIAKVESDFRPQIIGDGGESKGLFQIQEKWHGKVPDSPLQQLRKAESILEPLIAKYGLQDGVRRYNGRGTKAVAYSVKVLNRMKEIQEA